MKDRHLFKKHKIASFFVVIAIVVVSGWLIFPVTSGEGDEGGSKAALNNQAGSEEAVKADLNLNDMSAKKGGGNYGNTTPIELKNLSASPITLSEFQRKEILSYESYRLYRKKLLDAIKTSKHLSVSELKEMQADTEKMHVYGYVDVMGYQYINTVLLGLHYREDNSLFQKEFDLLSEKVARLIQSNAAKVEVPDPKFVAYKQQEGEVIRKANSISIFPNGMTREDYIEAQVKLLKGLSE